jgi:hypothetical protein
MLLDDILLIVSSSGFEPFRKTLQSNGGAISQMRFKRLNFLCSGALVMETVSEELLAVDRNCFDQTVVVRIEQLLASFPPSLGTKIHFCQRLVKNRRVVEILVTGIDWAWFQQCFRIIAACRCLSVENNVGDRDSPFTSRDTALHCGR